MHLTGLWMRVWVEGAGENCSWWGSWLYALRLIWLVFSLAAGEVLDCSYSWQALGCILQCCLIRDVSSLFSVRIIQGFWPVLFPARWLHPKWKDKSGIWCFKKHLRRERAKDGRNRFNCTCCFKAHESQRDFSLDAFLLLCGHFIWWTNATLSGASRNVGEKNKKSY